TQWFAPRSRDTVVDETAGQNSQPRNHVFIQDRHPDVACRSDHQTIEPTCSLSCDGGIIGSECARARIEAEQEITGKGSHPDDPASITGNLHRLQIEPWGCEKAHPPSVRVEATDVASSYLGEPDHALWIDGHSVGVDCLHTLLCRKRIVLHKTSKR